MDCSPNVKKKKAQGWFTLKCSVILSYLVSITSNILLVIILYLSDHGYKWPGFFLHSLVLLCSILSLRNLINFSGKNTLRFKSMTKYYSINLTLTGIFYFGIIIYMIITKTDMELIYYFTFCIFIWCIFHGLFISVINSFIKGLEDRPAQQGGSDRMIDKNLRDLMLSNQE